MPDAESRLGVAREALARAGCECGVSAWDGMLVARFLSRDGETLRRDLVHFLHVLRGAAMPRSWQT
jgi:urease accessory protein